MYCILHESKKNKSTIIESNFKGINDIIQYYNEDVKYTFSDILIGKSFPPYRV